MTCFVFPTRRRVRRDLVGQMIALLNQDRNRMRLGSLVSDQQLAAVAQGHSLDMIARHYFDHISPEGWSLQHRLDSQGIHRFWFGENLAFHVSVGAAHLGLMQSPGHRENILRPQFHRVGIAIVDTGPGTQYMITQVFSN